MRMGKLHMLVALIFSLIAGFLVTATATQLYDSTEAVANVDSTASAANAKEEHSGGCTVR